MIEVFEIIEINVPSLNLHRCVFLGRNGYVGCARSPRSHSYLCFEFAALPPCCNQISKKMIRRRPGKPPAKFKRGLMALFVFILENLLWRKNLVALSVAQGYERIAHPAARNQDHDGRYDDHRIRVLKCPAICIRQNIVTFLNDQDGSG